MDTIVPGQQQDLERRLSHWLPRLHRANAGDYPPAITDMIRDRINKIVSHPAHARPLCLRCRREPALQRGDRTFALCGSCGWEALMKDADALNDEAADAAEGETE